MNECSKYAVWMKICNLLCIHRYEYCWCICISDLYNMRIECVVSDLWWSSGQWWIYTLTAWKRNSIIHCLIFAIRYDSLALSLSLWLHIDRYDDVPTLFDALYSSLTHFLMSHYWWFRQLRHIVLGQTRYHTLDVLQKWHMHHKWVRSEYLILICNGYLVMSNETFASVCCFMSEHINNVNIMSDLFFSFLLLLLSSALLTDVLWWHIRKSSLKRKDPFNDVLALCVCVYANKEI